MLIFEHLFKGVSTLCGLRYRENHSKIHISSAVSSFQNLRLEAIYFYYYAPQTKILEGGTKEELLIFEALFKCVSSRFGLRTIEKCFENPGFFSPSKIIAHAIVSVELTQLCFHYGFRRVEERATPAV
jgi:hypothetical protein